MKTFVLEFGREASRPGLWVFAAGYSLVATGGLSFLLYALSLGNALSFVWLSLPLAFAVPAARAAVRDVEKGMASVLGVSPVPLAASVAGRMVAHAGVFSLALLPVAFASLILSRGAGSAGPALVGPHVAWGLLVTLTAILWGTFWGLLSRRQPTLATAGAGLGVALAYLSAPVVPMLLSSPLPATLRDPMLALLHLSPSTWATGALGLQDEVRLHGSWKGALLTPLLPFLGIVAMGLAPVHEPTPLRHMGRGSQVMMAILLLACLAAPFLPPPAYEAAEGSGFSGDLVLPSGRLKVALVTGGVGEEAKAGEPSPMAVALILEETEAPIRLDEVVFSSPHGEVRHETFKDLLMEPDEFVILDLSFTPLLVGQPEGSTLTLRVDVVAEGARGSATLPVNAHGETPSHGPAVALGFALPALLPAVFLLHGRANRA